MVRITKAIFLFLSVVLCIILLSIVRLVFLPFPSRKIHLVSFMVHTLNKILVLLLGIKIKVRGHKEFLKMKGVFFVINHVSYLDGVVASCLSPLVFIGRSDLKTWPLFGALTSLSDTIFVDRIDYSNIHRELNRIISMLNDKINVILFPEGTSTDGNKLLPFKTSFFDAPLKAGCKIVPLAIRYARVNSEQITERNKDLVYWYGDMYFLPHLLGVLKLKSIELEVKVFKPLSTKGVSEGNHSLKRKYLGGTCQELIENYLNLEKARF